jgi:hypothetical protein
MPYQVTSAHLQPEAWEMNRAKFEDSMACNLHKSDNCCLSLLVM